MPKNLVVLIVITALVAIYDWRISTGIILGYLFALLHWRFLNYRFSSLDPKGVKLRVYLGMVITLLIFACPILIAMLFPQFVHFFGVFIGLMYQKYFAYVQAFRNKG